MDKCCGIIFMQSNHPKFIECYQQMIEVANIQSYVFHQQSCAIHKIKSDNIVITSGYLISKFSQSIGNFSLQDIQNHIQFGLLKPNNTFIQLELLYLGFENWSTQLLTNFGFEPEIGQILYLKMLSLDEFMTIPKYTQNLLKHGQEIITISSPFAIQGQEMYKNYYRKAQVSQCFENNSCQIMMLNMISQIGQEGGSIFNSKGEYVGILLPNKPIRGMNSRYYTFCLNYAILEMILYGKMTKLKLSYFNSDNIDLLFSISKFARTYSGSSGSGTIIHDQKNKQSYFVTASHILESKIKGSQLIIGMNEQICTILEDCENDLDFALGQFNSEQIGIPIDNLINSKVPKVGEIVYSIGFLYSLFDHNPCIAKGTILKLLYNNQNELTSIVTDCFIHNGYSGGGLFNEQGELLGIISFNISHASEGVICDLSYITPIQPFQLIFQDLKQNGMITEQSRQLFSKKNQFAKEIRTLKTITQLPLIAYKPKL